MKRVVHCSICLEPGHRRTTCPHKDEAELIPADEVEDNVEQEFIFDALADRGDPQLDTMSQEDLNLRAELLEYDNIEELEHYHEEEEEEEEELEAGMEESEGLEMDISDNVLERTY